MIRRFVIAALIAVTGMMGSAAAAEPGIVLYSNLGYAAPVARAFTAATGIPMRVVTAASADILSHIMAQGRQPHWSLAWFGDAASAVALDQAGLLMHGLPAPPNLIGLGAALTSPTGIYVPTGITLAGALVAAANPHVMPPPQWAALTGPAYHGIVGIADPGVSRGAYAALAGLLADGGGWPQGKSFVSSLKQDGLHIYATNADAIAALRSGSIALAIVNSPTAFDATRRDKSLRIALPRPAHAIASGIVMARHLDTARQAAGMKFIVFVNRPATQDLRMRSGADGWYWPVTKDAAPHPGLPPLASLHVQPLDAKRWGRTEPAIITWFNKGLVGPGN